MPGQTSVLKAIQGTKLQSGHDHHRQVFTDNGGLVYKQACMHLPVYV